MEKISILGSTGSIGTQALEVIDKLKNFKVHALSANNNIKLLKEQIEKYQPEYVVVCNEEKADELDIDIEVLKGNEALQKIARDKENDFLLNSVVGSAGMLASYETIKTGTKLALANKESMVCAGEIISREAKKRDNQILPVDSEHSAIFQCLNGEDQKAVKKILLTCSGGALRDWKKEDLQKATSKEALAHPNWNMGSKITIDSATLMNKGLEVIEARWLFDVDYDDIEVVVHPQSIIHSMVEFKDNSIIAQMGTPSMKIPIQYALTYPRRFECDVSPVDFAKIAQLDFREPDTDRFPGIKIAYKAGRKGGIMPAVMNAANEVAVDHFLKGDIRFYDISNSIKECMNQTTNINRPDIKDIIETDRKARLITETILSEEQ